MDEKVLQKLEFDKIKTMLSEKAVSAPGAAAALALLPETRAENARRLLEETLEAESALMREAAYPIVSFSDISPEVIRLKGGGDLGCGELLRVSGVMKAARRAKNALGKSDYKLLGTMAEGLFFSAQLISDIDGAVAGEDTLDDSASPELRRIRKSILRENEGIREKLDSIIRSAQNREYLQDAIVTIRNDRYVVPVKQEHRREIKGLIHDVSSSGQTVFIEPMEVVEANNRLRELRLAEEAETARILREFSDRLRPYWSELKNDLEILTRLDLIFAKASLASSMKASPPVLSAEKEMDIRNARHPLIDPKKVVPVSLSVDQGCAGIIITGPNTGGKTVTLKLAGLLCVMAQSGLFVPADGGTKLPVFKAVYADIGDEQSIAQNLSTFSSHMSNITGIMGSADGESLVLLDELGAGTDPAEGTALAMSILEELAQRGCTVLATTHYSEIKAFAAASETYRNASMEFDIKTLSPTYRLIMGIPGVSNAFEISKKLGLSDGIIERARRHMSEETVRFERLLGEAERQRELAERKERQAESFRRTAQSIKDKSDAELKKANEKSKKIIEEANEKALRILKDAREEAERVIAELKAAGAAGQREMNEARKRLNDKIEQTAGSLLKKEKIRGGASAADISPGDTVTLLNHGVKATVLKEPKDGSVYVQAGALKLSVPVDEVEPAEKEKQVSHVSGVKRTGAAAQMQVDVRGMTLDEAVLETDKYLDDAYLSGFSEVFVIHGKGTGVLRAGIRDFLKSHPHVESYRQGRYGEGEAGVTVVTLKAR